MPQLFRVFRATLMSRDSAFSPEAAICRQLEEYGASGEEILFISSGDERESSVERSICQAAAWVAMPKPVRCGTVMQNAECRMQNAEWGTGNGEWGMAQTVLAPYFDEDVNAAIAATGRYREAGAVAGRRLWVQVASRQSQVDSSNDACRSADGSSAYFEAVDEGVASNDSTHLQMQRVADEPSALRHSTPTVQPSNRPTTEAAGLLPLLGVCIIGWFAAGAMGVFAATTLFSLLLFALVLCGITSPVSVWLTAVLSATAAFITDRRFWNPKPETRNPKLGTRNQELGTRYFVPLLVGFVVLTASAFVVLAHRFVAPYGLAITGGRAKLWFLSGGIPSGFFSNASWRLLEPAYPPGCAALTFGCYGAARFCGDWLTQLAPCVFAAVAAAFLASRTKGVARLWLVLLFLTPVALMTTGQFYPEPLMALGVLVGWERVRDGRSYGWLLLGAAGWFKNEGLFFLIAAWLAWRIIEGSRRASMRDLVCAMALPLAWHAGCRIAGATLNDYSAPWRLSPMRGLRALGESLKLAFLRPWRSGFAYPAAIVAALVPSIRREARPLRAALLFAAFSVAFFCLAYACSTADEAWHLSTSLPRLLWTPALILAREIAGVDHA